MNTPKIAALLTSLFFYCSTALSQDFKILSQLKISDNMNVSALRFDRDEYGIGLMNDKGVMFREEPVKSVPKDMAIMGDNVLVIGADVKRRKIDGYTALLVSKKTGAVVNEKNVLKKENSNRISASIIKDAKNNFGYLLLRETKYDEGFAIFGPAASDTKFLESSGIQVVALDNKLESKTIEVKTLALGAYFAGAVADEEKNIYVCSFTNELMTVEKFDKAGQLVKKLSTPFSVRDKNPSLRYLIKNESDNQQSIIVTANCNNSDKKNVLNTIKFDFSADKVMTAGEVILNKDYTRSLKNVNEEAKGKYFSGIESLEPIQILDDPKRIIVVKEIKFSQFTGPREPTSYYREGSIITIYNKKTFEVEKDIVVDKRLITFLESSDGIAVYLSDDFLWAVTCENSGLASFKTYVTKINISSGEVIKEEVEKEDVGKGWVTFPSQVAWFKKNYVIPFFKVKNSITLSFEAEFKVKKY